MQTVYIDFVKPRRPANRAGWWLLSIGAIGVVFSLGWDALQLQPLEAARQQQLKAMEAALKVRQPTKQGVEDPKVISEWGLAISIAGKLNLPWDNLLSSLEADNDRPVAVLSLEVDSVKGELTLMGEAKSYQEMLDYYQSLQRKTLFSEVTLHTHEVNPQDRERPIRFRITSKWILLS